LQILAKFIKKLLNLKLMALRKSSMNREPLIVDMSKPQESVKILPHAPVLSSQQIGWKGLLFQEFNHPSHEIPEYVLPHHMIIVGRQQGVYQENRINGKFHCRESEAIGDALIVPAGVTNATVWKEDAEFSLLTLCPKFVGEVAHESIDPDLIELIPRFAAFDPLIHQIGLSLKADLEAGCPTGRIFGESAATMLAARLLQQHSVRTPKLARDENGLSSYTLRQVLDYVRSNLSQDLSIIDLAQVAGMSPYYFLRLFKKSMHVTPRQYIIQTRIDRAKELLRSRELSIADISLQCGFTNQSHFSNVFRQITDTTPKAYRRDFQ
jgi:AraC family transcriptional regulator